MVSCSPRPSLPLNFRANQCLAIHVVDLAVAVRFYRDVLGLPCLSESSHCMIFDAGHFEFYLLKDDAPTAPIPSFSVKNLSLAKQHLVENGCAIVSERPNSFYFRDPGGVVFDVIEKPTL